MINLLLYVFILFFLIIALSAIFTSIITQKIKRSIPKFGKTTVLQDAEIHWYEAGRGRPIIMLHGLAGNLRNFTYALTEQLDRDYRVIAIDRAGSGWSKRSKPEIATLQEQARIISEFIEQEQIEKPLIVGHSLGGAIALALALDYKNQIAGLALICPVTQAVDKVPDIFRFLNISSPSLRFFVAHTFSSFIGILTRKNTFKIAFAPEPISENFSVRGGGDLALSSKAFIKTSEDLVFALSSAPLLMGREQELDVPTKILFGEHDKIIDAKLHGEKFAKLSGAKIKILSGKGHMLPLTQPEECSAFIRNMMNETSI
jgi:pimeloyl-ACP methyl ester carboxylesterase